jgi:hypothetical protein
MNLDSVTYGTWRLSRTRSHSGDARRFGSNGADASRLPVTPSWSSAIGTPSQVQPAFFHQGQLWLDADTGQLRRSVHEIVVRHPATSELLVRIHSEITYGPSDFGIFVPQRIVWEWMSHFSHPKNGQPSFALAERAIFTYGAFKRFSVATDERIKNPPEP